MLRSRNAADKSGTNRLLGILWLLATIAVFLMLPGTTLAQTTRFEAESAALTGATVVNHASASNGAYADFTAVNQAIQFNTVNATSAGSRTMTMRYANGRENNWGSGTDIYVNGALVGTFWDTNTGGWTTWASASFTVNLNAGNNVIRLVARYDHSPNYDYIEVPGTTGGGGGGTTLRVNSGGSAVTPFSADAFFSGGTTATNWTGAIDTAGITNPAPAAVYQSERYGVSTYTFTGLAANTTHNVRLHFCENYFTAANQRRFNVAINGTSVLSNFDIFATAGAIHKAVLREFNATSNGSGQITVALTNGSANNALINGIEVIPGGGGGSNPPAAPTGVTATPGDSQVVVSWNAVSGATSYKVKISTTSGGPYSDAAINLTSTSYTVNGLINGTTYYFVVSAVNSGGESPNSAQVSATPNSTASLANAMGINILGVSDYFEDRLFADAMRQARDFELVAGGAAPIDSNGWPTSDFKVVVWHGISSMNGTYKLRFTGQATVAGGFGASTITNVSYNSGTNTTTADLNYTSTDGAGLQLTFTATRRTAASATNTGVTNINLMRPLSPGSASSYAFGTLFSNQIKTAIAKFSVIRFMDYSATNSNNQVNWADRVLPAYASMNRSGAGYGWQGKGGAWEYAIQLANETGKDAWICVPAKATNDYITKLAQTFRYGTNGVTPYTSTQASPVYPPLNSGLKLYVEFSNELWNTAGAFQQSFHNRDAAVAEVNAGGSPLNYDGLVDSGGWTYAWRRIAKRGVDISLSFRTVFGDSAMMARVRPVLMSQLGYTGGPLTTAIGFLDGYYNNTAFTNPARTANYYFYGAGGSAYYGPDNHSDSLTLTNIWNSDSFNPVTWEVALKADIDLIAAFGMKRIAYEGGPSMDNVGHSESVKAQAWTDTRMQTEVLEHHASWSAYGGDLLVYFNVVGDYQWGFAGSIFNLNTPKYLGIDTLNGQNRGDATYGVLMPATIAGNAWVINNRGWGTPGTGSVTMNTGSSGGTPNIQWTNYTLRASGNATYNVRVNYSSSNAGTLQVYFDGNLVGTVTVAAGASNVDSAAFPVTVAKGIHGIRVRCTAGPVTLNQVKVQ